MTGRVTAEKTIPALTDFLAAGGTILTIGSSTALADHLGLPVTSALVERDENGVAVALPREKFFVPGSVMRARFDSSHPLAFGMDEHADVYFRRSPVFRLLPDAHTRGATPVSWFDSKKSLRSGWAWGESYLENGVGIVDAQAGAGRVFLFGPEINFRAQPHGTFKLLFNGLHIAGSNSPRKNGR